MTFPSHSLALATFHRPEKAEGKVAVSHNKLRRRCPRTSPFHSSPSPRCVCMCVCVCVCVRERERERENEPLSLLLLLLPPSLLYLANLGEISPLRTVKDLPDEERGRKPGDGRTAYFLPPYSSRARTSVETVAPFASAAASDQANERGGEVTLYLADFADNVKSNLLSATFVVPRY